MKRLNIFVDETGEFGFGKKASRLYGVSFTFHEQDKDIKSDIDILNERLAKIGYTNMIHMADLIMKRNDYSSFNIETRKNIFNAIYHFSRKANIKYCTIIIDKKYANSKRLLRNKLSAQINKMIMEHWDYFDKFDNIVMFYDNGQEPLGYILDLLFSRFDGFLHKIDFNHKEKRLFQVSDMLTYIDKAIYKHKNNIKYKKAELYFFGNEELRKIARELDKNRF